MTPLTGNQRARQDLLQVFPQYDLMSNINKMIAMQVLPPFNVQLAHGTYPVLPIKELMKRRATAAGRAIGFAAARAPRGAYNRSDLEFTQAPYNTEEHGFEGTIDANERAHYSSHFDHEATTALKTFFDLMLELELRTMAALSDTTVFTPGATGLSQDAGTYYQAGALNWLDHENSKPRLDIFFAKRKVWERTGQYPDCLLINEDVYRNLRLNEDIRQQWMAIGAGSRATQRDLGNFDHSATGNGHRDISMSAIAQVLDVEKIIVACSVMDSNNGTQPFQAKHIWGDDGLLFKAPQQSGGAAITEIALGHTLLWTPDSNLSNTVITTSHGLAPPQGVFVEDYYEDQTRKHIVRCRHQTRALIKYKECAELMTKLAS